MCVCVCGACLPYGLSPQWDICQAELQCQHLTFSRSRQPENACTPALMSSITLPLWFLSFFSSLLSSSSVTSLLSHFINSQLIFPFQQPPLFQPFMSPFPILHPSSRFFPSLLLSVSLWHFVTLPPWGGHQFRWASSVTGQLCLFKPLAVPLLPPCHHSPPFTFSALFCVCVRPSFAAIFVLIYITNAVLAKRKNWRV